MTTEILLAPASTGKTDYALKRLLSVTQKPFAPIWVLLATRRQEDAFRARLMSRSGGRVLFNVEFFNFYDLYRRILSVAGRPARSLDETGRYRLLRVVIRELHEQGHLPHFGSIAHTPGFVKEVAEFIYELKQNVIYPFHFRREARAPKDFELAQIYESYQEKLQRHNLVDREGEGWLALASIQDDDVQALSSGHTEIHLPLALLLADGFDLFNELQARLVARLAGRAEQALITLTTVAGRESTIGRRFKEARERLLHAYELEGQPPPNETTILTTAAEGGRAPDLRYLLENIFRPINVQRTSQGSIRLLEAPDMRLEVGAVLREVKRLLLQGCPPDDILIALRDWSGYSPHFRAVARHYGIPLALHYGESLLEAPPVIALLNLLELRDFRRRALLDVLRSPYFSVAGLGAPQIEALEKVSRALLVIGGREMWLDAIDEATRFVVDEDREEQTPLLDQETAEQLKTALLEFFDNVTPPARANVEEYVNWLETLIGPDPDKSTDDKEDDDMLSEARATTKYRLRLLDNVRQNAPDYIKARDLLAMQAFKRVLRGLLAAEELLKSLGESRPLEWAEFLGDLRAAIASARLTPEPTRSGRVLVTTATNARGLPHQHVFVLGLSEGLFPQRPPEDSLYTDTERKSFQERSIPLLTRAERSVDEGLFYELIGLPRETLTLSRPYSQDGKLWIESHLWRQTKMAFVELKTQRIPLGTVVTDPASREEAALAAADGLNRGEAIAPLYNWLMSTHPAYWSLIRQGRTIEARRLSRHPHDRYSGRLHDATLIEYVREALGAERIWSASQLNEYGQCGFRFFARRLLNLEEVKEPEEGLDTLGLGSLYHKILENTYARLKAENFLILEEYAAAAITILREEAANALASAPRDLRFRATTVWEGEQRVLLRRLEALLRLDFSEKSPMNIFDGAPREPHLLEAPFGFNRPQTIELADGERLRVRGFIDRIDKQEGGAVLVDYKSGSTEIPTSEMQIGRNFQMMLYLLVAPEILDMPLRGGMFWHIRSLKSSGIISPDDEALNEARARLTDHLQRGRTGDFTVEPTKFEQGQCSRYCEFAKLCRVGSTSRTKIVE